MIVETAGQTLGRPNPWLSMRVFFLAKGLTCGGVHSRLARSSACRKWHNRCKIICNIQKIFLVSWGLPRRVNMLWHATASTMTTISMTTSNVQCHLNSAIQAAVACYGKVLNTHPGVRPWYHYITDGRWPLIAKSETQDDHFLIKF